MSHRSRLPQRIPLTAIVVFGMTGAGLAACEHSDAAKAIERAGLARRDDGPVDDGGPTLSQPRYFETGADPTATLATTAAPSEAGPAEFHVGPPEGERTSCNDFPVKDLYVTDPAVLEQTQQIVKTLSPEQMVLQMTGIGKPSYSDNDRWRDIQRSLDDPDSGLRGYQWRDGPHGVNLESGLDHKGQIRKNKFDNFATSFPTSVVQGAAFDMDLAYRVGEAMGDETAASKNNVLLTPCMNILRNPLWGRAQETFGEDAYLLGRIATGITIGVQEHVAACAKHYIANNIELQRMNIDATMDEQTLRESFGRHFEMVSRDGGIACMMASYNKVNGVKVTQNKHVLTDILKYDFGFRGFVLTDWWAMPAKNSGQGGNDYTVSEASQIAAEAVKAGLDVEVPWAIHYENLPSLITQGVVNKTDLTRATSRVVEQKLRFNSAMMNSPWSLKGTTRTGYDEIAGKLTGTEPHLAIAREAAEKGTVLLKNDGGILPIRDRAKVAVIGPKIEYYVKSDGVKLTDFDFARDAALGDRGSSRVRPDPALSVGPLAGLTAAAPEGTTVVAGNTAAEATDADFVVVVVGLTAADEGEEYTGPADRENLALPLHWSQSDAVELKDNDGRAKDVNQDQLIADVLALGKPTVVVIEAGGAVDGPWLNTAPALVMAWYGGQRAGEALGNLLFGKTNFSGRLPITWPMSLDQFPTFSLGHTVPNPMEFNVGYRYFDEFGKVPRYAFGYGMSYTTFAYEALDVGCGEVSANGLIEAKVTVRNTGTVAGDEIVQLYTSYPGSAERGVRRPIKELRGFARVSLQPGEAKTVTIPVRVRDLKYFDMTLNDWAIEEGTVEIRVGGSSDKLFGPQTVQVHASPAE